MIGGDDDKFATGQKAMGAASASMGSAANSAANKAAQKQGGLIVNSGTNFTGPVAGANEQDIQSQVFGKGYTDLARGLARALGQDKWANRDNLQNQTMQENAFLNQVMKTGQTNIVTGGFSTNGMNIAQNALALGSKGAGNAAANEDNPLGLTGDKAVAFNNRLSSNVSPYVSRAQALADASAIGSVSVSGVAAWGGSSRFGEGGAGAGLAGESGGVAWLMLPGAASAAAPSPNPSIDSLSNTGCSSSSAM